MAKKGKELTLEEKLEQALVPAEEQPYEVPENWCWTYLDRISSIVTGGTPSKKHTEYYGGDFPFYKPADLDAGRNIFNASEYLTEEGKKVSRIINKSKMEKCFLPLPPLVEQQRIVDRIESLFAKLDEAKEKIQNVLDESDNRKSVILCQKVIIRYLQRNICHICRQKKNGIFLLLM